MPKVITVRRKESAWIPASILLTIIAILSVIMIGLPLSSYGFPILLTYFVVTLSAIFLVSLKMLDKLRITGKSFDELVNNIEVKENEIRIRSNEGVSAYLVNITTVNILLKYRGSKALLNDRVETVLKCLGKGTNISVPFEVFYGGDTNIILKGKEGFVRTLGIKLVAKHAKTLAYILVVPKQESEVDLQRSTLKLGILNAHASVVIHKNKEGLIAEGKLDSNNKGMTAILNAVVRVPVSVGKVRGELEVIKRIMALSHGKSTTGIFKWFPEETLIIITHPEGCYPKIIKEYFSEDTVVISNKTENLSFELIIRYGDKVMKDIVPAKIIPIQQL
jgi:hypothetical protein